MRPASRTPKGHRHRMDLLILGGTVFLGRHLATAALSHGHRVTLFNRGQHNPDLFPQVEKLRGDRTLPGGLDTLKGRTFDAVIDTCGYVPRIVRESAEFLAGQREMLLLHLLGLRVSGFQDPGSGRDSASRNPRRRNGRGDHRRDLRPAQGPLRKSRGGGVSRSRAEHSPRS
jgi:hypothetical protein